MELIKMMKIKRQIPLGDSNDLGGRTTQPTLQVFQKRANPLRIRETHDYRRFPNAGNKLAFPFGVKAEIGPGELPNTSQLPSNCLPATFQLPENGPGNRLKPEAFILWITPRPDYNCRCSKLTISTSSNLLPGASCQASHPVKNNHERGIRPTPEPGFVAKLRRPFGPGTT
jgi:hypothetical protein